MSPTRKGVLALTVLGVSIAGIVIALSLGERPAESPRPQETPEVAAQVKLQEALRDASLLDLIRNARVAARKGDSVTHYAMVSGLKREPQRARTLIKGEINRSNDSADISILNRMIQELP